MNEKIYYSAEDIAKMLGVSMGKAYKILREMNKDLASKGFLTIAGKIPVEYFKEKIYTKIDSLPGVKKELLKGMVSLLNLPQMGASLVFDLFKAI